MPIWHYKFQECVNYCKFLNNYGNFKDRLFAMVTFFLGGGTSFLVVAIKCGDRAQTVNKQNFKNYI
jgi:hypothetical protein